MIKQVTMLEAMTKLPTTDTITKKEHTLPKMEQYTMDTMTNKEIGLILVTNNMIRVSIKDIGMKTINGLTQVVKIMTKVTRIKQMIKSLTII
jgi:hypothetical protein